MGSSWEGEPPMARSSLKIANAFNSCWKAKTQDTYPLHCETPTPLPKKLMTSYTEHYWVYSFSLWDTHHFSF